jgi:hypothetical protein
MDTGNFPQPRMPLFRRRLSTVTSESTAEPIDTSAGNVESWNAYLPADCVNTMVKMGWDQTT